MTDILIHIYISFFSISPSPIIYIHIYTIIHVYFSCEVTHQNTQPICCCSSPPWSHYNINKLDEKLLLTPHSSFILPPCDVTKVAAFLSQVHNSTPCWARISVHVMASFFRSSFKPGGRSRWSVRRLFRRLAFKRCCSSQQQQTHIYTPH